MTEESIKLNERELAYALAVMDTVGGSSINAAELSKYPESIINWLLLKELLLVRDFEIGSRILDRRVALGHKVIGSKKDSFDYRMRFMIAINQG